MKDWKWKKLKDKSSTSCLCCWSSMKCFLLRKHSCLLAKESQLSEKYFLNMVFPWKRSKHSFLIGTHVPVITWSVNDKITGFISGYLGNNVICVMIYLCVCMCVYVHMCTDAYEEKKTMSDSPGAGVSGGCRYYEPNSGILLLYKNSKSS